jgi:predicted fused transcriptional regulator/phosphomethylpyrimidine kinase
MMQWAASQAFERADGTPVGVVHPSDVGRESVVILLAGESADLIDRTVSLTNALDTE